jgi:hypothetical protein
LDGTFIRVWNSVNAAAMALNISQYNITNCCIGKTPDAGTFKFQWRPTGREEEEVDENEEFSSMATYQIKSPELKESIFKVDTDLTSIFQEYREVQC